MQNNIKDTKTWTPVEGSNVVLIEPDEPWYINLKREPEILVNTANEELRDISYRNNADFLPSFVMDTTSPDMGYGYSYSDRQGTKCSNEYLKKKCNIESFNQPLSSHKFYKTLVFLFVLILICQIFKPRYNK